MAEWLDGGRGRWIGGWELGEKKWRGGVGMANKLFCRIIKALCRPSNYYL